MGVFEIVILIEIGKVLVPVRIAINWGVADGIGTFDLDNAHWHCIKLFLKDQPVR